MMYTADFKKAVPIANSIKIDNKKNKSEALTKVFIENLFKFKSTISSLNFLSQHIQIDYKRHSKNTINSKDNKEITAN